MNSREIVQRATEFNKPERIPGAMPPPYWNDLFGAGVDYPTPERSRWHRVGKGRWERVDEWGNTWARADENSQGEVVKGALESLDDVETIPLPDLANPAYYEKARLAFQTRAGDKYRLGGLPGFAFNIARKLRKLEQYLMDLALEPDRMMTLSRRIDDLLEQMILQYARIGADAVMLVEDWGTQQGLMIHPEMWRRLFKPGFARLCHVAHGKGLKVWMHSCGKMTAIIPDLIEVGVDLLQFDQPRLHGLDSLAQFAGRISFWCPVDIQRTLQTRDPAQIEADAREMIYKLGGQGGGFVAGYYHDNASIGLDPALQKIACQAFTKYGCYK
jgi:hypothetical protein